MTGRLLWFVSVAVGITCVLATRLADAPDLTAHLGAGVIAIAYTAALSARTGGRPILMGSVAAVYVAVAIYTRNDTLVAGASVGLAIISACLAVMITTPAKTLRRAFVELFMATAVAFAGGFGVAGFGTDAYADVDRDRFGYVVLGLAIFAVIALVYRLGAGLHGLGRRGYFLTVAAVVVVGVVMAYAEALGRWGDQDVVGWAGELRDWTKESFKAVPHPIVSLVGYPALLWGTFMRARRRQGWWVTAFGIAATAPFAGRLAFGDELGTSLLSFGYTLLVGGVIGVILIRGDLYFTGSRGRRARRTEEAGAIRPEPGRFKPLH